MSLSDDDFDVFDELKEPLIQADNSGPEEETPPPTRPSHNQMFRPMLSVPCLIYTFVWVLLQAWINQLNFKTGLDAFVETRAKYVPLRHMNTSGPFYTTFSSASVTTLQLCTACNCGGCQEFDLRDLADVTEQLTVSHVLVRSSGLNVLAWTRGVQYTFSFDAIIGSEGSSQVIADWRYSGYSVESPVFGGYFMGGENSMLGKFPVILQFLSLLLLVLDSWSLSTELVNFYRDHLTEIFQPPIPQQASQLNWLISLWLVMFTILHCAIYYYEYTMLESTTDLTLKQISINYANALTQFSLVLYFIVLCTFYAMFADYVPQDRETVNGR